MQSEHHALTDSSRSLPREHAVMAYYDRLASVYGDGEYFRARRAAVLTALSAEIAGARAVLDLGCGNGAYLTEFRARNAAARLVGVDLSPHMLQAGRQRLGEYPPLVRADATRLPFLPGRFDLVFMSHVLLLVADIERCVEEVAGSLAPGGLLVATVGTGGWPGTVRPFLGAEVCNELEALFGGSQVRAVADDETRAASACTRVGLQAERRSAPFSITWADVEEWVRIRWFTVADETLRVRGERWLAQVRPRAAGLTVPLTETLLVARKPPGGAPTAPGSS